MTKTTTTTLSVTLVILLSCLEKSYTFTATQVTNLQLWKGKNTHHHRHFQKDQTSFSSLPFVSSSITSLTLSNEPNNNEPTSSSGGGDVDESSIGATKSSKENEQDATAAILKDQRKKVKNVSVRIDALRDRAMKVKNKNGNGTDEKRNRNSARDEFDMFGNLIVQTKKEDATDKNDNNANGNAAGVKDEFDMFGDLIVQTKTEDIANDNDSNGNGASSKDELDTLGNRITETKNKDDSGIDNNKNDENVVRTRVEFDIFGNRKDVPIPVVVVDDDDDDNNDDSRSIRSIFDDSGVETLGSLEADISRLEIETSVLIDSALIPPQGLTMEEYASSIQLFLKLPFSTRVALCDALELDKKAAVSFDRAPEIVEKLYLQRVQLTPKKLADSFKSAQERMEKSGDRSINLGLQPAKKSGLPTEIMDLKSFFDNANKTVNDKDLFFETCMPKVTRKKGIVATEKDLDTLLKVLTKENFVVSEKTDIPGGYIIRGQNKKKSGKDLLADIDAKIPSDYPSQVSLMPDLSVYEVTSPIAGNFDSDPVLMLLNKDFSLSTNGALVFLCSAVAVVTTVLFSLGTYGSTDLVTQKINEANSLGPSSDFFDFLGARMLEVIIPLFALQALRETGQFAIGKIKNIDTAIPTLLPYFPTLPFLGAKTRITTSPETRADLFDFAFAGPFLGIVGSLAALAGGLQLTASATAETSKFFPGLPLNILKTSSLGGTLVDYFLGGGDGFIVSQDPSTVIALHPIALAGFVCLLMNALDCLPFGTTNGGRMSMSIFGRAGQTVLGSLTWIVILVLSFFQDNVDVLIGGWLVYFIVQNDMEIPCRDEVEEVDIPRVFAAIVLWFVAVLALTPL